MHEVNIVFNNETSLKTSDIWDLRNYSNISIQIIGMSPGDIIQGYGSLFEGNGHFIPFNLAGSLSVIKDGIYIVPPYFRFYRFVISAKASPTPIRAYLYSITDGTFPQPQEPAVITVEPTNYGAFGIQSSAAIETYSLDEAYADVSVFTIPISSGFNYYVSHIEFSLIGFGANVGLYYRSGTDKLLFEYSLTTFSPTVTDVIHAFHKIERPITEVGELVIKARKYGYDQQFLSGRVTVISDT